MKIVVRMRGGLGNQLFILSFAYFLLLNEYENMDIVLDIREYESYKVRKFEILELIKDSRIRIYDDKKDKSWKYDLSRNIFHIIQKILPDYINMSDFLMKNGLYYSKRSGRNIIKCRRKNIYVYGYFQDVYAVEMIKANLLSKINTEIEFEFADGYKYIAVSVRCGKDYKDNGWPICEESYFKKGIDFIISKKYRKDKVKIIVFADDMSLARNMINGENVEYMNNYKSAEQIKIMSKCDDFVISNSSFSWWGAYIGCKKDSIVVMPKLWYSRKDKTKDTLLLYKNTVIL